MKPERRRKPTSGLKFAADSERLDLDTESIGVVVERARDSCRSSPLRRPGVRVLGVVADDVQVLEEREVGVDAEQRVLTASAGRRIAVGRAMRADDADVAAAQDVALQRGRRRSWWRGRPASGLSSVWMSSSPTL